MTPATATLPIPLPTQNPRINLADPAIINPAYQQLFHARERFLVLCGGAGSGKSIFAAQKILIRCMESPGQRIVVTRKIGRTLRQSCYAALRDVISWLGVSRWWKPHNTEMTLTYRPGTPYESSILCVGLDDPEKIKSIHGISSFWHEEPTELTRDALIQANLRLRVRKDAPAAHYRQHILSFNPINEFHWLREMFYTDPAWPKPSFRTVLTTVEDNLHVDTEYKASLDALEKVDANLHKIYRLGLWGSLKGLIFEKDWDISEWPEGLNDYQITYGLDFGYNDPTVLVRHIERDQVHTLDEVIYERGMTTSDIIDRLAAEGVSRNSEIYADCADPGCIEEIARAGYNIFPCKKGEGSIKAGLLMMLGLIARGLWRITERSAAWLKEKSAYKWRERSDGSLLDVPVDAFNHAMDAARYIIFTKFHHLPCGIS